MNTKGKLFVIAGASGVGKGTLLERFLQQNEDVNLSISYTTRLPRPNEKEGVNYFYITSEKFKQAIDNNEFLEWAMYSGNYYGTKSEYVYKTLNSGKSLFLEIDVKGALQVIKKFEDIVSVFILPPSLDDLKSRLINRGTETSEIIQKRLDIANEEIKMLEKFKYKIVNDNIDDAVALLQKIYDTESLKNNVKR